MALLQGCSSSGQGGAATGGTPGSGGVTGDGGNATGGSTVATGGNPSPSGGNQLGSGGIAPNSGGITPNSGGIAPNSGGITPSSGGIAPKSGGAPASGGATTLGSGGSTSKSGGATSGGGATSRGGASSPGGASSSGGPSSSGGVTATGGTTPSGPPNPNAKRFMEKLDRGLIAVKSGSGYFLSWRLFGTDPQDTSFGFNVYRGTTKLNTALITDSTNYTDSAGGSGTYTVKPVTGGVEGAASENAIVIDNGYVNIPLKPPAAGSAHGSSYTETANDASIGDLDGDGQYEIVLKWDPSNSHDNAQQGYTGPTYLDGYKLDGTQMWRISLGQNIRSGAHYTQFMVYDLDGDGSAEVACKTAPGTKDGTGAFLKTGPAATADHTIDYTSTDTATQGKVITGPEYYTIFSGKTGAELVTVDYKPGRGAEGVWGAIQGIATPAGDLGWGNDSNYNFVDRFLASVAYLDGERPSVIPCRGYYWRSALWALDWRNGQLTERWLFDTAAVPGAKGKDGKLLQSSEGYESQGSHSLRQGDVDGDGFDEIVYGSATIDHDGQGLYSTGLRHGDALHLSDLDPDRPGLEVWMADEQSSENGGIVSHFQDATDGTIIWQQKGSGDNGRGCTGPLMAGTKGWQMWSGAGGLFDAAQKTVGSPPGSDNFTIWWGSDLNRFLLNGTSISAYSGGGTGLNASGCTSNNTSKSTPALTADIFGDWREEVVFRTTGNDALRIYTTTTPTTKRLYTLMHDPIYRMSVATENVAYNQPPEPGIYIGPLMTLPQTQPNIKYYDTAAH
jgi:rhamnogalacturonan endolyase